ncbi:hypothetical protein AnigIFM63604_001267 [Aspergillus niger]|uniref:Contig An02c0180, genomic contig n=3 Tax=Aspergillus TaxID=5052 RepID=A2QD91_ASPNC|nr:uncharacterized protein An02g06240 [Aspergillus niger]XP_025461093.1 uncharacterized protein BO96DRAFT_452745 [Aspergillus niger CBS 101883]RDK44095.1 hypothetical protein M752DRAFT_325976 [Aspergillus phoenicis ATCC 13157]PYH63038.1 hypothetical protein BO96DRAFT_452745 [Aspergillus niger CBS 101883]CAK37673.1 unnamed protein product [Aspergillus niger]GJP91346.1 hypothetical protein AlacWU_04245 [Aspergillus niger]GKZ71244.1 hypothetical protein AnigIFM50267_006925 [Aspergillus niger]
MEPVKVSPRPAESAAKPKAPEQTSNFQHRLQSALALLAETHLPPTPLIYHPAAMMSQTLRASRSLFTRVSRQQVSVSRRTFLTSAVRQADPVQELYLRELRAYKPTPVKPGDADAHVQKFAPPAAPQSPEEANLANELKSYESQEVEVEGQAAAGEAAPVEESWFEEEPEEEAHAAH